MSDPPSAIPVRLAAPSEDFVNPAEAPAPHSLAQMVETLQAICSQNHGHKVSVGDVVAALGPRSFAPVVLAIGLLGVTPIDSIPTLPTTFGIIVFLTVGQMLLGRKSLWLPKILSGRAVSADRMQRALAWLMPYARAADRYVGSRLVMFTQGPFLIAIAVSCLALAGLMPMLELVPLVSTIPSLAIALFGIALLSHDGAAALAGFALTVATLAPTLLMISELVKLPL